MPHRPPTRTNKVVYLGSLLPGVIEKYNRKVANREARKVASAIEDIGLDPYICRNCRHDKTCHHGEFGTFGVNWTCQVDIVKVRIINGNRKEFRKRCSCTRDQQLP